MPVQQRGRPDIAVAGRWITRLDPEGDDLSGVRRADRHFHGLGKCDVIRNMMVGRHGDRQGARLVSGDPDRSRKQGRA